MLTIPLIWIIAAIIAGVVASNKNRGVIRWVLGSIVLTPLIVLILLVLPTRPPRQPHVTGKLTKRGQHAGTSSPIMDDPLDTRKCPFCAEEIKTEAVLCKHCGKDVPKPAEVKPSCPSCGIERAEGVYKCDCGWDYVTRKKKATTTTPNSF